MRIKIVKCSSPAWWYAGYVGRVFIVSGYTTKGDYMTTAHPGSICPDDCEIVKEETEGDK